MFDAELFAEVRTEFANYLRFTKGYSQATCYNYHSDLGIWVNWLQAVGKDWQRARPLEVEQFIAWQLREKGVGVPIVARRLSTLSTFYRWAKRNDLVTDVPTLLADKPKRPHRIPVWLDKTEQKRLEARLSQVDDLPANIFGQKRQHVVVIRQRYEILFLLLLYSGLRISEALGLKVQDIRVVEGVAKSLRVIGKGNKERLVPLPAAFGEKLGDWLQGGSDPEFVFAQKPGGKPPSAAAARAYLQRLKKRAGITKKISPHKLRHTYATRVLETGAQLVDIQALLGHVNLATTQIYTHVDEDRMAAIVSKL